MKTTRHYLISGVVQGVGYRRFVEKTAAELNLTGWVRNLYDGRVETIASGESAPLDTFEAQLQIGPRHAEVMDVKRQMVSEKSIELGLEFIIMADGEKPWSKQ